MISFFAIISNFYSSIFDLFNTIEIDTGGITTTLGAILMACLVIGFCVSIFWKGARA